MVHLLHSFLSKLYVNLAASVVQRYVACRPLVPKFADTNPAEAVGFFRVKKILSTPRFGRELKPFIPCRRFTACKRSLNVTWKSGIFRQNSSAISRPSSSSFHSSGGDTWRCKQERLKTRVCTITFGCSASGGISRRDPTTIQYNVLISLLPHACGMSNPHNPTLSNHIQRELQEMKLTMMQYRRKCFSFRI